MEGRDALPNIQDVSPRNYAITQDSGWKTFFLYVQGYRGSNERHRWLAGRAVRRFSQALTLSGLCSEQGGNLRHIETEISQRHAQLSREPSMSTEVRAGRS